MLKKLEYTFHGFVLFSFFLKKKKYNVASLTLPGYEPSSFRKSYEIDFLVNDLQIAIENLNLNKKNEVYIVAHDWGAALIWELSIR